MNKKDKIIGNSLIAITAFTLGFIYLFQRKTIKEQNEIIEDQFEMLDIMDGQLDDLVNICKESLNCDDKDLEKIITKSTFKVVSKVED